MIISDALILPISQLQT